MAFGTLSKIFTATVTDQMNRTSTMDINLDTHKVALYGNTGTPDQTVASANAAYNVAASPWVTANETTATGWPAGGNPLTSVTSTFSTNVYTFDAADRPGGANDTVSAAYGCLIYDDTVTAPVADQAWCWLAFGGSNSVSGGTFTVVFNASGIMTLTV